MSTSANDTVHASNIPTEEVGVSEVPAEISKLSIVDQAQIAAASGVVVQHPLFRRALTLSKECVERGDYRAKPTGLMVMGLSGCGKTTLAKELQALYPRTIDASADALPVLYVETPSDPTIKNLAESILAALDIELPWRCTEAQMTKQILKWLKARKVRVIVIDEIQHFADQSQRKVRVATDYMKKLINDTNLPIILLGLPDARRLLDENAQLRRRFSATASLRPFAFDTKLEKAVFCKFLKAIDGSLGMTESACFHSPDLAQRFYFATAGIPAHVMTIALTAAEIALKKGAGKISRQHLATAFRDQVWEGGVGPHNPFDETFVMRPLIKAGEPFADLVVEAGP